MKTEIVLCPTLRRAFYEWHRLADTYPDMWTDICRNPMSLTSIYGVKYIFRSDNETDKLYGFHGDIISIDEFFEPTCDTCKYTTAAFNPCNECKDKSEYAPQESEDKEWTKN